MNNFFSEFQTFVQRGNVIDLAVAVVIGAAFSAIVTSLVNDIIMPPIGMLLGGADFTDLFITLSDGEYDSLAEAQAAGAATINYGLFINSIINFVIVALAVFIVVRQVNNLQEMFNKEDAEEDAPTEPSTEERLIETLEKLNQTLQEKS